MNLHDRDIIRATRKEAFAEGCNQKSLETAENLLKMNVLSPAQISQASGLPLEQVLELQKNSQLLHRSSYMARYDELP